MATEVKREYRCASSGRPYMVRHYDDGQARSKWLPIPPLEELVRELSTESEQRLAMLMYARGISDGQRQQLDARDQHLVELAGAGVPISILVSAFGLSRPYLRSILRRLGLGADQQKEDRSELKIARDLEQKQARENQRRQAGRPRGRRPSNSYSAYRRIANVEPVSGE